MTAIDDFQADVHRALTRIAPYVSGLEYGRAVDKILTAHTAGVAAALGEIDGYRRNRDPAVHYQHQGRPACRVRGSAMTDPAVTSSRLHVTCRSCQNSHAYKET